MQSAIEHRVNLLPRRPAEIAALLATVVAAAASTTTPTAAPTALVTGMAARVARIR